MEETFYIYYSLLAYGYYVEEWIVKLLFNLLFYFLFYELFQFKTYQTCFWLSSAKLPRSFWLVANASDRLSCGIYSLK